MIHKEKPCNEKEYIEVKVDGRTFYAEKVRRTSYSERIRNRKGCEMEVNRKLKILAKFKDFDFDGETEKCKECIFECLSILKDKYNLTISFAFKYYNLKSYGFMLEDFGLVDAEEEEKEYLNE